MDYASKAWQSGFMGQQPAFGIKSTGITCQAAICADDPMAGDDDGYGIMADGVADGLRGNHAAALFRKLAGKTAVRSCRAIRNLTKQHPDGLPERSA